MTGAVKPQAGHTIDTSGAGAVELHTGHGALDTAGTTGAEVVTYNPDAPSEEWGWHGHWSDFAPRGRFLLLGLGVVGLLLMVFGNHQSHVEDYFLVIIALILAFYMYRSWQVTKRRRRGKI